ncbi:MAG: nuclear transport factor 2 family protein, partial [Hyphomonadaceae bacterium]
DQFDASTPSEVRVYAISENIAAIELIAADWYDAFTAVRTADGWRLLDCVWGAIPEYQTPEQDAGEAAVVMAVAETFARGVASADRALLDDAIHPNLTMRSYEQHDGVGRIVPITRESLYLGAHGAANLASPTTPVHTTVHNATARTALVQIEHGRATYFVQMLRINGDWRVINVTWAGA